MGEHRAGSREGEAEWRGRQTGTAGRSRFTAEYPSRVRVTFVVVWSDTRSGSERRTGQYVYVVHVMGNGLHPVI